MDDKEFIDSLLRTIDHAYWCLEVGDRIGAIKVLSLHAKPRKLENHWLQTKENNNVQQEAG